MWNTEIGCKLRFRSQSICQLISDCVVFKAGLFWKCLLGSQDFYFLLHYLKWPLEVSACRHVATLYPVLRIHPQVGVTYTSLTWLQSLPPPASDVIAQHGSSGVSPPSLLTAAVLPVVVAAPLTPFTPSPCCPQIRWWLQIKIWLPPPRYDKVASHPESELASPLPLIFLPPRCQRRGRRRSVCHGDGKVGGRLLRWRGGAPAGLLNWKLGAVAFCNGN